MQQDQGGQPPQQQQAMKQQARAMAQPPSGSVAQPGSGELLYQGTRRHTAAFGGYLKWLLVSAAGGGLAYALGMIDFFATWPLWVLGLVGIPGLVWNYLVQITTKYKISLRRVEYEHGVLSKHVDSLELWRVLDVRYNQNLIDRMLGNAKITLIGTDQTDPELVMYGLPNHRQLFEKLRDAVQEARHTSRPMELVGQDGAMENVGEF
jgi:uncharacterized membrane protein YdbT with pleckstrin-like domain